MGSFRKGIGDRRCGPGLSCLSLLRRSLDQARACLRLGRQRGREFVISPRQQCDGNGGVGFQKGTIPRPGQPGRGRSVRWRDRAAVACVSPRGLLDSPHPADQGDPASGQDNRQPRGRARIETQEDHAASRPQQGEGETEEQPLALPPQAFIFLRRRPHPPPTRFTPPENSEQRLPPGAAARTRPTGPSSLQGRFLPRLACRQLDQGG